MSSIINIEKKILKRMTHYYKSVEKATDWYNKLNRYFTTGYKNQTATPKQLVNEGRGKEVLEWIKLTIGS